MDIPLCSEQVVRCDLFQKSCDHIYWSNAQPRANNFFQAGDIVFCKIDEVLRFFELLRLTRKCIVLVTGEGDHPCNAFQQQFLPSNVIRWFATNVIDPHPRVTALPLGLGGMQDRVTLNIQGLSSKLSDATNCFMVPRDQWLYINFRPETNPLIRRGIYNSFKDRSKQESWITFDPPDHHGENKNFLEQLKRHRFVLAPPGNGIDTHRLWEALTLGAYPVALKSSVLKPFEGLPILFVDHYDQVSWDFLKANLSQLEEKKKNYDLLKMGYWVQKIQEVQSSFNSNNMLSWSRWLQESFSYGAGMVQRKFNEYHAKY